MSAAAEARTEHVFTISRVYPVSRQTLWNSIANVEHLEKWWGPQGCAIVEAKLDFRPGGRFFYGMKFGTPHVMHGLWVIGEIVEPEKIVWINSFADADGGVIPPPFPDPWPVEFHNTFLLEEADGGTKLTVISKTMPNASAPEIETFEKNRASLNEGWSGTFERLYEHLSQA